MAKKKKKAKARKAKAGTFSAAMEALAAVGVPIQKFGKFDQNGTPVIDRAALDRLKSKLGKSTLRKARFVAFNAPFKRGSPISPD